MCMQGKKRYCTYRKYRVVQLAFFIYVFIGGKKLITKLPGFILYSYMKPIQNFFKQFIKLHQICTKLDYGTFFIILSTNLQDKNDSTKTA